jgi:hypothetical protein
MTRISTLVRTCALRAGAMAVLSAVLALSAKAQVLDQIPSDALVVAKVKNLQQVSDKAGALAKQWGLAEMNPAAGDPLGFLIQQGNMTQGIDKAGDLAFVLANGDLEASEPRVMILVPVSDYQQFLGNFAGAAKEGDLDHFKMKFKGEEDKEETYSAHWGNYAVLSPMKDLLAKKPDGFKASGASAKELETKDAIILVNLKVLGPKVNEKLKAQHEKILDEVQKNLGTDPEKAKYVPLAKVAIDQALNAASELLTDTQFASYSINLSKDGVSTTFLADFAPASTIGKALLETKGQSGSLLAGLPEAKYLAVGGGISSEAGKKMINDLLAPIQAELAKSGDQVKPFIALLDGMKKMMDASKAQAGGMIAPSGALGATALLQTVSIITGNPKDIIESERIMIEAQQSLTAMLPNQPGMKVEAKADAKTVDGVSFTQMAINPAGDANSPEAMQIKQMMAMMYGPNGANVYLGAVDDQHVLMYSGLDDATVSAAIKAAKEHTDTVSKSEGIVFVNKNLPDPKLGVAYISIGEIVTTASNYAKMMGIPIPINMKPNLPPIAIAIATEGSAVRADTFIPSDLVEQVIATVLQLKMMGGGGNGKPGGL